MVVAAIAGGAFTGSDLWRIYVGLEVNSLLANHWYSELVKTRNYNATDIDHCPLCFYADGELVASCDYHREIYALQHQLKELRKYVQETEFESSFYPDINANTESQGSSQ